LGIFKTKVAGRTGASQVEDFEEASGNLLN
jgi:hypothetical protein